VSLRTQELYAIVFVCRYLDLAFQFISLCVSRAAGCVAPASALTRVAACACARLQVQHADEDHLH
jgi:hypothetical protein